MKQLFKKTVFKGSTIVEYLVTLVVIGALMYGVMLGYKTILFRFSLNNEATIMKKYIQYAQEYADNQEVRTVLAFSDNYYTIHVLNGKRLKKHFRPKKVRYEGKTVIFTPNRTPNKGATIIIRLEKRHKKITIDPSTGRVKIHS